MMVILITIRDTRLFSPSHVLWGVLTIWVSRAFQAFSSQRPVAALLELSPADDQPLHQ